MMGIILKSTMISFGIATIAYCINIALAQIDPAGNISAPTGNTSAPAVNSTTIGIPESPTIVGPSSLVASPITSEANGTNSTE
ncbi:MAG: hypothetical protein WBM37_00640 [Nitrososphaeraceae archaeon]|jgi:hypothetical protein